MKLKIIKTVFPIIRLPFLDGRGSRGRDLLDFQGLLDNLKIQFRQGSIGNLSTKPSE